METGPLYVGSDVSKDQLDVAERPSGERAVMPHTEPDIATLVEHLRTRRPACVVLEATGGLQAPLASALAIAGIPVAVVNPRQVRDFARATGQLAKTEAIDAHILARFAEAVRPTPRPLPDEKTQAFSALLTRRRPLIERNARGGAASHADGAASHPAADTGPSDMVAAAACDVGRGLDSPDPRDAALARAGGPAAQCAGHRPRREPDPARGVAGVGHADAPAERGLGRRGPAEPGQGNPARPSHHLGRPGRRPRRPVYERLDRGQV